MLIMAALPPNHREFVQWVGRIGRNDKAGQYAIVVQKSMVPDSIKLDDHRANDNAVRELGRRGGDDDSDDSGDDFDAPSAHAADDAAMQDTGGVVFTHANTLEAQLITKLGTTATQALHAKNKKSVLVNELVDRFYRKFQLCVLWGGVYGYEESLV